MACIFPLLLYREGYLSDMLVWLGVSYVPVSCSVIWIPISLALFFCTCSILLDSDGHIKLTGVFLGVGIRGMEGRKEGGKGEERERERKERKRGGRE